jgi:RNA polymerase sigma factor (sigma-70 family)
MRRQGQKFELSVSLAHPSCKESAMIDDVERVHAAQAGDVSAMGALLEDYRARLYAAALTMLGDRAQAQDAVQDAFLVALRRLGDLREPEAVGGWLHTIVRNECRMRLRAYREVPGEIPVQARTHRWEIDEEFEQLALRDWLWTTLEVLPDDLRATVMLRYFTRHTTYTEIAAILGIPVGTVRSRLHQAKRRLADALLASVTAAHRDHGAFVAQRVHWWRAVVDEVEQEGTAALYIEDAVPNTLVEAPAMGYRAYGVEDHARGMVETVTAGVRVHLTDLVTSAGVTIVEGDYENPPDDPHHCPATHTEVRFHPHGRTTRIILFYYGSAGDNEPTGTASS